MSRALPLDGVPSAENNAASKFQFSRQLWHINLSNLSWLFLFNRYAACSINTASNTLDKIALYDLEQDRSINWGKLADNADQIARYLVSRGIQKGDRIGLLADESLDKMIIWMGIWRLGAVVCPLNVEINAGHINELLQSIGPKLTLWHTDLDGAALTDGIDGEVMRFDRWEDETSTGTMHQSFSPPLPRPTIRSPWRQKMVPMTFPVYSAHPVLRPDRNVSSTTTWPIGSTV